MSAYQRKLKRMMKHERFSDLVPVIEYWEDEKAFLCDGPALAMMFICQPTNGGNDKIRNGLANLYKTQMPEDTLMQVSLVSTPDIENQLYGFRALRGNRNVGPDKEQSNAIGKAIHDFYRNGTRDPINEDGTIFRDYEVWFTVKMPLKSLEPTEKELNTFRALQNRIHKSLNMFAAEICDARGWTRRMRVLMNMYDDNSKWRERPKMKEAAYSTQKLSELCLAPGSRMDVKNRGVSILDGNDKERQFIKSMSITEMHEEMVYGQMLDLMGDWLNGREGALNEHFMLTLNIWYPNQNKAKSAFQKRRGFVNKQAKGSIVQYVDRLRFQNKDFSDLNRELDQEKSALLEYSLQMTVIGKTEKRVQSFAEDVKASYEKRKVTIVEDSMFTLPFFISSLPMGMNLEFKQHCGRFNQCTSKALTFMTPHMASWKGNTSHPAVMLTSRLGQVVNIDPFQTPTNYNIFTAATSGAGKSFWSNYLTNCLNGSGISYQPNPDIDWEHQQNYDDGAQVFIIDVGRSYEGLASQFEDSQFLSFNKDTQFSLNPFLYIHEFDAKDSDSGDNQDADIGQSIMVLNLLKTMASQSGQVNDFQHAELFKIVIDVWKEKGNEALVDDVVERCNNHSEQEMNRLGAQLSLFCQDGPYGAFFRKDKPPVNFDSRLVVVELEELEGDEHLLSIVLMAVVMAIEKAMYLGGTDRRKILLLDEAWKYIKSDKDTSQRLKFFSQFLEKNWRRLRKYNGAGIMITQSLLDGYQSDVGRAILANSYWKFLLMQDDEVIDKLEEEKAYSGSRTDFKLLKSLHTRAPEPRLTDVAYSEIYIKSEGNNQVCRLYTDRRTQLLLTTHPNEKKQRNKWIERGYTLNQAVEKMLEEERALKEGKAEQGAA